MRIKNKHKKKLLLDNDPEIARLTNEIAKDLKKKIGLKFLPSIEEQLARFDEIEDEKFLAK